MTKHIGRVDMPNISVPRLGLYVWLGIVIGIVMPIASALIYPTYMHQMQPEWAEWTRLLELPFIACELVIIHVAIKAGYRDGTILRVLPTDVLVALALLVLGLTVSSVMVSKNPAVSITLSITTLIHLRLCAVVFFLAKSAREERFWSFFLWLGLGLVALTLITVWKFQFPPAEWTVPGGKIEWSSALPGFISVRHFGSWSGAIAAGLMIALLYGRTDEGWIVSFFYLLAAGLTFWSGTRAAVLAMVVVALVVLVSLRRLPNTRALVHVSGLSIVALFTGIFLSPNLPDFMLYISGDAENAETITSGRLILWYNTLARWLDAPIFGWGSGSTFWELGWIATQPHNAVVQFLISWGIIGAGSSLWLLIRAIVATHRTGMEDDDLRPISATLYSLLFMSLLEGMLYYPRFIILIMISLAVLLASRKDRVQD